MQKQRRVFKKFFLSTKGGVGGSVLPQGQRPGGCTGACLIQIAGALKL